jgi:phosphoacetylglucosamine mutase
VQLAPAHAAARDLLSLAALINQAVGDAISGILLVEAALRQRGWGLSEWAELYTDLPSRQMKVWGKGMGGLTHDGAWVHAMRFWSFFPPALSLHVSSLSAYPSVRAHVLQVKVADRSAITTEAAETRVAAPPGLQELIDREVAVDAPCGRAFVRPSGTEDVVRVYAEAASQAAADALALRVAALVHANVAGVGPPPAAP